MSIKNTIKIKKEMQLMRLNMPASGLENLQVISECCFVNMMKQAN